MEHVPTILALVTLTALGLSMAIEDHRTTYVALWKLLAFTTAAGLWAATTGALAGDRTTALTGMAIGATTSLAISMILKYYLKRPALGEADTWILAAGGAVLGIQWIGPWLGLAAAIGLIVFPFCAQLDQEDQNPKPILPFVPTLVGTLLLLAIGRALNLLPPTIL